MNAPKRWIDTDSGSSDFEREILGPASEIEIPAGAQEQVWSGLAALVSVAALPAATAATAAAVATSEVGGASGSAIAGFGPGAAKFGLAALVKAFAVGAISGTLVAGGYSALESNARTDEHERDGAAQTASTRKVVSARSEARTPAPLSEDEPTAPNSRSVDRHHEPTLPEASSAAPSASSPAVAVFDPLATPAANASRLREEARVLARARTALRQGDLASAFAALEVARSEFAAGMLSEEREALTIELLARSGQREAARARAHAFLRAYPRSAHRDRVRSFAD